VSVTVNVFCDIAAAGGSLGIQALHSACLHEAIGDFPTLQIDAIFRDSRQRILNAIGAPVRLLVQRGGNNLCLFEGIVRTVQFQRQRTRLTCVTAAAKWDLTHDTRSFATVDGALVPLHSLPGFQTAFSGIGGLNRLTAQVTDVTQFEESSWAFLRRLSARFGMFLLVRGGQVELVAVPTGAIVGLVETDLMLDEEEVTLRSGVSGVQSLAWQYPMGQAPAATGQKARKMRGLVSEDSAGQQGEQLAGATQAKAFFAALAPGWSNADEAGRRARLNQGQLLRWRGSLLHLELGIGQQIRLPSSLDLGAPLTIFRRSLTYSPQDANYQLINCVEAAGEILDPELPSIPAGPRVVPGVVLAVQDPAHLGRVRVRFPWQSDNEGLWCLAPQPFAGSGHGALNLPAPNDWVVVNFEPDGLMPPTILGSIYHSGAQASSKIANPAEQRLLAQTPAGLRILLDDAKGELTIAAHSDDQPVCSVVLAKEPGMVTINVPNGKVLVQAGNSKLSLGDNVIRAESDAIDLNCKSSITLTAPQIDIKASRGVEVSSRLSVKN